jgi:hypothetical protein
MQILPIHQPLQMLEVVRIAIDFFIIIIINILYYYEGRESGMEYMK